ncbi:hypothetical protein [Vibrio diabolicus]|uniref:hypothetical protein n=1 Tax=Vibrio diabolicus TaxID=50719 RepID=UPI00211B352B|nr:hypothetical protein [Vibrio diabolicus]
MAAFGLNGRYFSAETLLCEFTVSKADLLGESPHCEIAFPKGLFGVVSPFSAALHVPSGFSDRRFETTPDLSFTKYVKVVLVNR